MPTPKEEAFREELLAERDLINDVQGLGKFREVPQDVPQTSNELVARQSMIGRRVQLIDVTLKAMEDLDKDGYPGISVSEVTPEVYEDLQDDIDQMTKALEGFRSRPPATSLGGTLGTPQPKGETAG